MKAFDAEDNEILLPEELALLKLIPAGGIVQSGKRGEQTLIILEFDDFESPVRIEIAMPKDSAAMMGAEMARERVEVFSSVPKAPPA